MKIVLIGFMGSGKSSIAKRLGQLLKWPTLEMDEEVLCKTHTKNMHEVFAKGGELLLRETELLIAQEYALLNNSVISTGGGVVLNKRVLKFLKGSSGKIVFLNATFQTIAARLAEDVSRPLFKNKEEAYTLYQDRKPLYQLYADQVIEVDHKSVEEIAQEIVITAREYGK